MPDFDGYFINGEALVISGVCNRIDRRLRMDGNPASNRFRTRPYSNCFGNT